MKSEKTWIAIVAIVTLVSGFFVFSTLKAKESERSLRLQKEQELIAKSAELARLQTTLDKLTGEKAALEQKMQEDLAALTATLDDSRKNEQTLTARVATLSKEKEDLIKAGNENAVMLIQLKKKIDRLEQERLDLQSKLTTMETTAKAAEALKGSADELNAAPALAGGTALPEPVNLGKIVVQKLTSQAARVEYVNSLYGFVIVNAGADDGLRTDMLINITRDNRFVARAVLKKLRDNQASAVLLPEWMREEIKVGDLVRVE